MKIKQSEYLEKYGFDIPFTEKELSTIGKDVQFLKNDDQVEMEGIITDLRFGDSTFIKKGKKYLSVQFAIGDWWSEEFPTKILAPPVYDEYTEKLVEEATNILKDEKQK